MKYENSISIYSDLEDEVGARSRKLMIKIDRRVVLETPRDTGSAKASWLASVGRPDNRIVNIDDDSELSASQLIAIENGAAEIKKSKGFDTIYICNNQPYIKRLNEGWSLQAPSNYIDAIIAEEVAKA